MPVNDVAWGAAPHSWRLQLYVCCKKMEAIGSLQHASSTAPRCIATPLEVMTFCTTVMGDMLDNRNNAASADVSKCCVLLYCTTVKLTVRDRCS